MKSQKQLKHAFNRSAMNNEDTNHSHSNLSLLNAITPEMLDRYHFHSNLTTLSNLTQAVIDDSHPHSNLTTLSNLTQSVIDNSHTHTIAVTNLTVEGDELYWTNGAGDKFKLDMVAV